MMLDAIDEADLSSLRVLFTGGEAVPYSRAAAFEERTGARVLQFYGSNETGALSRTTLRDSRDVRLRTAGHLIPEMQVRLFDEQKRDVTASGRGQPGCRGPLTSAGYWDDPGANEQLFTTDGWMLVGDVAEIDCDGVLRVVGRTADIIIRGGKNISAPVVEAAVMSHPAVALAAAVPAPDPRFGERVCAVVELHAGGALDLPALVAHLREQGVSVESWPEHLIVLDELPRSSGGKIAKGALRETRPGATRARRGGTVSHHITRYDQMPIPPVESQTTWFDAGAVRIGVEYRLLNDAIAARAQTAAASGSDSSEGIEFDDRGVSLHVCGVGAGDAARELLRFDCFEEDPHYHYVSWRAMSNEMLHIDPIADGDPLAWALERIRTRLPQMLERAGAPELAARVDVRELERALPRVAEAAYRARYRSDAAAVLRAALGVRRLSR